MKRIIALLLPVLICAALLAACGAAQDASGGSQSASGDVTVEEQTILDEKGVTAVVKGFGKYENELMYFDRALLIEVTNNTEKDITFGLSNCSINSVVADSNYSYTVEKGKTEIYPAVFDEVGLEVLGVTTYADYEFCVVVQDAETNEELFESDPITVMTSAYEGYDYRYDESGTVLYDADGVKIIALDGLKESEYIGQYINLYVINETDKYIDVSVVEGFVNGEKADTSVASYTPAGKRNVDMLSSYDGKLPDKIESVTLSFSISNWDNGDVIVEKTDPVTVTF